MIKKKYWYNFMHKNNAQSYTNKRLFANFINKSLN